MKNQGGKPGGYTCTVISFKDEKKYFLMACLEKTIKHKTVAVPEVKG